MPENPARDPDLALTAFLYASDELDPAESAAFEERLASDQEARDALALAVQMAAPLTGAGGPDPGFRDAVRRRLLRRPWLRGDFRPWAGIVAGVAAAALVVAVFAGRGPGPAWVDLPVLCQDAALAGVPLPEEGREPPAADVAADVTPDMANHWADLSNPDRVNQAVDEEQKRRARQDDWRHLRRNMQQAGIED